MSDHLPPGPYQFMTTAALDQPLGNGHVYLIDRDGRKIAALWGEADEKMALAEFIIKASEAAQ